MLEIRKMSKEKTVAAPVPDLLPHFYSYKFIHTKWKRIQKQKLVYKNKRKILNE